jgi:PadR family transcriptional regulator PadR
MHYMGNAKPDHAELVENLRIELRSGCLVLAVLAELRAEHYGYTLRRQLADLGLAIEENTLYPMLRRLEAQGLLASEWREEERRRKRFYRLSPAGERVLDELFTEWDGIYRALQRIRRKDASR